MRRSGFTVAELLVVMFMIVVGYFGVVVTALAFWTQRNFDYWGTHFAGHIVHVPFWLDWLVSIFSPIVFVLDLIGEIARHF